MDAVAERQMLVGEPADVEGERVVEDLLVPIARRVGEIDGFALGDGHTSHRGVLGSGAHELLDRCGPPDHLLDRGPHEFGLAPKSFEFTGVLDERPQAAGDGVLGGVVPGAGHDHVVRRGVDVGQGLAVDEAVGDGGRQVVCGVGAS